MPSQPNESLIEGLRVLQTLVANETALGSREMAALLGIEHTRVNRLLGTLAMIGLAQKTPERKYRPGPAVHVLAAQSLHGSHLLSAALPHLVALSGAHRNVTLGVLWQRQISYLFRARPGMNIVECIGNSPSQPAAFSTAGIFLLAHLGPDEAEIAALEGDLRQSYPREFIDVTACLNFVLANGYARIVRSDGDISLAVGIRQADTEPYLAGLALSDRFTPETEARALAHLQETASQISQELASHNRK